MENTRPIKILMVQTANQNLGDQVLADNDCYLIKQSLEKRQIPYELFRYNIASRDITQIKYVDVVVFAGGIIKDTNEYFHIYIPEIIREANEHGVPVFMCAIGVEPFNPESEYCINMREALNLPVVKMVSIRDDIDSFTKDYLTNPDLRVTSVIDPAIWSRECYRDYLPRKLTRKKKPIGLGITRHKLFSDYGNPQITKEMQMDFWKRIVEILEERDIPWIFFTNGDASDEKFCYELLEYIGYGDKYTTPLDGIELVQLLETFSGVIAGRMHSNIISYSLGIPSVGFIWNQKLRFWANKIGQPERFMEVDELDPDRAVELLFAAMKKKTGPDQARLDMIANEIDYFVENYCKPREKKHAFLDYRNHVAATSLGCIAERYRNTNSPEALDNSLAKGYKNLELDVRLTEDLELVCVKKWSKDTYQILNYRRPAELLDLPLTKDEYIHQKYYNRFSTATLSDIIAKLNDRAEDFNHVFINIGKSTLEHRDIYFEKLKEILLTATFDLKKIIIRFERKDSLEKLRALELDCKLAYHFTTKTQEEEKRLLKLKIATDFCKENELYISVQDNLYTDYIAEAIRNEELKACVFSCIKVDSIIDAINNGAYLVGSHYYDVDYINRLTK